MFKPCKPQFFNDGSTAYCQPCSLCPTGYRTELSCNKTADTKCAEIRLQRTEVLDQNLTHPATTPSYTVLKTTTGHHSAVPGDVILWAVPLAILILVLVMLTALISYMRLRKRGWNTTLRFSRRASYINAGFSSISATPANCDQGDFPSPDVLSAPLQKVLDNLDVLEELVILLDPESQGVKNTKHLASLLSFPATWINYTYSMKSSKSPLKTVLEGVTSRHPDWTVRHLVEVLQQIKRNDAIAVLSKIRLSEMTV